MQKQKYKRIKTKLKQNNMAVCTCMQSTLFIYNDYGSLGFLPHFITF